MAHNTVDYISSSSSFRFVDCKCTTQAAEVDTTFIDQALNIIDQQNQAAVASQETIIRCLIPNFPRFFRRIQSREDILEAMPVLNAGLRKQDFLSRKTDRY